MFSACRWEGGLQPHHEPRNKWAFAPGLPTLVSVDATVPNCDIEVDGEFVGNTPSLITLAPGKHQISVQKTNYHPWTRTITFTGGTVHLNAEMVTK